MEDKGKSSKGRSKSKEKTFMKYKKPKKKVCAFCVEKTNLIDYKNSSKLRRFMSDRGKILSRRITGNCAKHQRLVTKAIKRARVLGLIPFTVK